MGATYLILPLDEKAREALADQSSVDDVETLPPGRNPLRLDVIAAIKAMPWLLADPATPPEPSGVWRLTLTHRENEAQWAALAVPANGQNLAFEAGDTEVMCEVLSALSHSCGTLVLWPDTGDDPIVIQPPENRVSDGP